MKIDGWKTKILAAATLGLLAWGLVSLFWRDDNAPEGILTASGRIEGEEVRVGSKIAGRVLRVLARAGEKVQAGELIAEISAEELRARVDQARAQLEAARSEQERARREARAFERQLAQARTAAQVARARSAAEIERARAALAAARSRAADVRAEAERLERDLERFSALYREGAISARQLDEIRTMRDRARAQLELAERQVAEAQAALALAETTAEEVKLRELEARAVAERLAEARAVAEAAASRTAAASALLAELQATFDETRIVSPINGTVIARLVEPGELVQPGTPVATIIDLSRLFLRVYIPEKEIGKVRLGDRARVYVDAFPDRFFAAEVSEIAQEAEFTPKTVQTPEERTRLVFAVKLRLENPEGYLKPGMPADAHIRWKKEAKWPEEIIESGARIRS